MALDYTKLEEQWSVYDSPIARDLKLNLRKLTGDSALTPVEAAMVTLAVAKAVEYPLLIKWAASSLERDGIDAAKIQEVEQSAALMGMLNTYYKFRGFMSKAEPAIASEHYGQAGLRMTALARPQVGKENFELLALAVSAVNGCETCVTSHEKALRESGLSPSKIHDAVRLAAVVKGLSKL